jgi:hypothetical protein
MSQIYYKLWNPAGLFNQVLSLETAVGIQHKANKTITLYNTLHNSYMPSVSDYHQRYSDMISLPQNIVIDDIFTWDSKDRFIINDKLPVSVLENKRKCNLMKNFLVDSYEDIEDLREFGNGRSEFYLDNQYINFTATLVNYSYFFYNRDKELDKKIGSVSAKSEYLELAKKIAISLGDFDGIHLRLTDFPTYIYTVTKDGFNEAMQFLNSGRKIVICTDERNSRMLKNLDKSVIFLDQYIYENFYNDFKSLTFNDKVIFGLINNLVMHYSKDFIGTPGSTYTSYIQKGRVNMGLTPSWKCFSDLTYKKTGRYSWTNYPIPDDMKSWWREWEECLLIK